MLGIPANFFWDISVRFLSWECWDFWRRHDHFRRFPKKSEVFRRRPKSADGKAIEKTLTHKIIDREEGIVIYSFYSWFSFLTWLWVNIFLEIVSSKTATIHIFQSGVRNWPAGVRLTPKAWELAGIMLGQQSTWLHVVLQACGSFRCHCSTGFKTRHWPYFFPQIFFFFMVTGVQTQYSLLVSWCPLRGLFYNICVNLQLLLSLN